MKTIGYDEYFGMDAAARARYCHAVAAERPGLFTYEEGSGDGELPTFVHRRSGLFFKLVFRDEYVMGLSEEEAEVVGKLMEGKPFDVAAMQPAHREVVGPFLMSVMPVMIGEYLWMGGKEVGSREGWPNHPVGVTFDEAMRVAGELGFRLPRESEWEYACRGKTTSVFAWGNALPPEEELDGWLNSNFSGNWSRRGNRFGFKSLYTGEWCEDRWRPDYRSGPVGDAGERVVRGGGACFWPWQDTGEWVWCMSAMRVPTSALFEDRKAGFRLVREVGG